MKLKEARARRYVTIRQLAELARVSTATIQGIEAGKTTPTLTTAAKLARALEMNPDDIDELRAAAARTIEGRSKRNAVG